MKEDEVLDTEVNDKFGRETDLGGLSFNSTL